MKRLIGYLFLIPLLAFGQIQQPGTQVVITGTSSSGGGGGSGTALQQAITQSNSFTVGEAVASNGTIWVAAEANLGGASLGVGIVTVATSSSFTVVTAGLASGLSGLTAGDAYYLSDSSAGTLTTTAPTTTTSFVVPVMYAISTTSAIVGYIPASSLALISNASLANSSVTIGSTSVSLGATVSTFAGVTLTAPTFTTPALGTPASGNASNLTNFPTLNQNTTGTAANLSGTPALPNGTTATTQTVGDNTTDVSTDAFVLANVLYLNGKNYSGGSATGGTYTTSIPLNIIVSGVTVLTAGTPSDIVVITLPTGYTIYHPAAASAGNPAGGMVYLTATGGGTNAGASFTCWDASGGTGTQLTAAFAGPTGTSSGLGVGIGSQTATLFSTTGKIYIRQTANSANAGTATFVIPIYPLN